MSMTTETSNAREWVLVPREPTQAMLDSVCSAEGIEPWTDDIMRQTYIAMLDAAPPPAAARGGVRGLVAKWRADAKGSRSEYDEGYSTGRRISANELEAALAAEGVQAGEVEIGYGWELDRYGFPNAGASQPAPFIDGYWTPWHIAQRRLADALSLSQQPEARGVVDESAVERACAAAGQETGSHWPSDFTAEEADNCREVMRAALTAALTGERNG